MGRASLAALVLVASAGAVGAVGCDLATLADKTPSLTCEWQVNEFRRGTVDPSECWRAIALATDARVRLDGEACSEARQCLTAHEGETIVPLTSAATIGGGVTTDDYEVIDWPCDELATACEGFED